MRRSSNNFIRFICNSPQSLRGGNGVFWHSYKLVKAHELPESDETRLRDSLKWFEDNLPLPDQSTITEDAIFWFRGNNRTCILKIWEIVNIIEQYNMHVKLAKTNRPGYVVHKDEYQIAAVPFSDTFD